MLRINVNLGNGKTDDFIWQLGDRQPLSLTDMQLITYVYADSHELRYIDSLFPMLSSQVINDWMIWFGDNAKFIVANLTLRN